MSLLRRVSPACDIAEPPHAQSAHRAPYLRKFGKLSMCENLVMTSPSVRTLRVEVSRNKFLSSPLESFLLFQKALEIIDKSESAN